MKNRLQARSGRHDERGVTLITFALSLVAMCAVIALVLGGSIGYNAERDSQTASDAAALAATSKLREFQLGDATASEVATTAQSVAEANDSDLGGAVICEIVNANYAITQADSDVIGPCSNTSNVSNSNAAGVRVRTSETENVPFGAVSGQGTIAGETPAAATIQPLASGNSPFMVCSTEGGTDGHPVKVLLDAAPYNINPAAIYNSATDSPYFMLWGEDLKNGDRQCGGSSDSWRGWVDNSGSTYSVPGWWENDTGNKNGHLVPRLVINPNGCDVAAGADADAGIDGCVIVVPLCTHSNNGNGNNLELYCVRYGTFELSYHEQAAASGNAPCQRGADNANKVICGKFLGPAIATSGQGSTGQAGVNDTVLVKLVQ